MITVHCTSLTGNIRAMQQISNHSVPTGREDRLCCSLVLVFRSFVLFLLFRGHPQLVVEFEALREEFGDTALSLGNVFTHHELAIYPHVVNGVELAKPMSVMISTL